MTKWMGCFAPLAILLATAAGQQPQQTTAPNPEMPRLLAGQEGKLVALTNEWTEAINSRDRAKLDELMAPDYALYSWNGKLLAPRSQWLDNLFTHITIEKNTLFDIFPRLYGDVAIMTSKGDWIGTFDGRHFKKKCTVVDTWRNIEGRWRVVNRTSECIDQ